MKIFKIVLIFTIVSIAQVLTVDTGKIQHIWISLLRWIHNQPEAHPHSSSLRRFSLLEIFTFRQTKSPRWIFHKKSPWQAIRSGQVHHAREIRENKGATRHSRARTVRRDPFDDRKQCIVMFRANEELAHGATAYGTGWGVTKLNPSGPIPYELQSLKLNVINKHICSCLFRARNKNFYSENEVCAAGSRGSLSFGDSGGPLVVDNKLAGVAVRANNREPDVFTEVAQFRNWIDNLVGTDICAEPYQ